MNKEEPASRPGAAKTLYKLALHESMVHNGMNIMRVPGGWIYDNWNLEKDAPKRGIFVPFNNEFNNPYWN